MIILYLLIIDINRLLFLFFVGVIIYFLFKKVLRKNSKHTHNIKLSARILNKINTFEYSGQKINYIRKIDPFVFEELVLNAFESKGYKIKRNKRYTGDGGIDGIIYSKSNRVVILQVKRYSSYIKLQHLKDFKFLIIKNKAAYGYFIHTGKTGKFSKEFAAGSNINIISGNKLIELISR